MAPTSFAASTPPPGRSPRSPAAALLASSTPSAPTPGLAPRGTSRSTRPASLRSLRCAATLPVPKQHIHRYLTGRSPRGPPPRPRTNGAYYRLLPPPTRGIAGPEQPPHSPHRHRHQVDHHARRHRRSWLPRRRRRQRPVLQSPRHRDRPERRVRARGGARLARTSPAHRAIPADRSLLARAVGRAHTRVPIATHATSRAPASRSALTPRRPPPCIAGLFQPPHPPRGVRRISSPRRGVRGRGRVYGSCPPATQPAICMRGGRLHRHEGEGGGGGGGAGRVGRCRN